MAFLVLGRDIDKAKFAILDKSAFLLFDWLLVFDVIKVLKMAMINWLQLVNCYSAKEHLKV